MQRDRTLETRLSQAHLAIENALNNPAILSALADFGYTRTKLQKGKQLYSAAAAAQLAKSSEVGEQISATAAVQSARQTAEKRYSNRQ